MTKLKNTNSTSQILTKLENLNFVKTKNKSNCDKTQMMTKLKNLNIVQTQQLKGEQDTAEVGANSDENDTCTNICLHFSAILFTFSC